MIQLSPDQRKKIEKNYEVRVIKHLLTHQSADRVQLDRVCPNSEIMDPVMKHLEETGQIKNDDDTYRLGVICV